MNLILKWKATDGTPQELNANQLLNHEKEKFCTMEENYKKNPTSVKLKALKKQLKSIEMLERIIAKYQ